jgi:hypothetical protein
MVAALVVELPMMGEMVPVFTGIDVGKSRSFTIHISFLSKACFLYVLEI